MSKLIVMKNASQSHDMTVIIIGNSAFEGVTPYHTCDISLFRRDLPIFEQISLFGMSKLPYITYTSPYFKFQISLFGFKNFLLCLIILPILKSKSPYLASQMYHMYAPYGLQTHNCTGEC